MLITLKQKEIEAALRLYIASRGILLDGKDVEIAFTNGRKDNGLSAEVDIKDDATTGQAIGTVNLSPVIQAAPAALESAQEAKAEAQAKADTKADAKVDAKVKALFSPELGAPAERPVEEPEQIRAEIPAPAAAPAKASVSLFNS